MNQKNFLKDHSIYFEGIFTGLFSLLLVSIFLQISLSKLTIPFHYEGDSLQVFLIIKSILDNGWYLYNTYLGAPFGLEHYDFPVPDVGTLILIKAVGYLYPNPAIIYNVIFLGSFFFVSSTSYIILCKFNINKILAFSGAILFTFLPFHFLRIHHFFYTWYFTIPIYIFLCKKIMSDKENIRGVPLVSIKDIVLLMFCTSFGLYFAFFASALFVFSAIYLFQSKYKHRQIQKSIAFIVTIYITLALIFSPNILYKSLTPSNNEVAVRLPVESEIYGLRISQLMLPFHAHRISWIAEKTKNYNETALVINENIMVTLGFIGSIGFIILLINIFMKEQALFDIQLISQLSKLNLACILLGTIGGLGSLFALFVSPMIRGYNRISVFISFISITTVILVLQKIIDNRKFKKPNLVYIITTVLILLIGLFDQTSTNFIPNYEAIKKIYQNDAHFIQKIEESVTSGTMIYQLPYIEYPERPPLYKEGHYGLIRGYIHSKNLRWSYGAMRGRDGDLWLRYINTLPIEEQIQKIAASGFGGIYIDRQAFEDHAINLENKIKLLAFNKPLISEDNNLAFYFIKPTGNTPENIVPLPSLGKGFYQWDGRLGSFVWASGNAELHLINLAKSSKEVQLSFDLHTLIARNVLISITNDNEINVNLEPHQTKLVNLKINLGLGRTTLKFKTDTPAQLPGNGDLRELAFSLQNIRIKNL